MERLNLQKQNENNHLIAQRSPARREASQRPERIARLLCGFERLIGLEEALRCSEARRRQSSAGWEARAGSAGGGGGIGRRHGQTACLHV